MTVEIAPSHPRPLAVPWLSLHLPPMRLRLFGSLQLEALAAAPQALAWARPTALLACLASAEDWLPRDTLATLLRPEADTQTARAYLRRLLHRLREQYPLAGAAIEIEPTRLRWAGTSDVREFRAALSAQQWDAALALHGGEFLAGMAHLGDSAFDDWLDDQRIELRRRARSALAAAISQRDAVADAAAVLTLMQRLVQDDPLDEEGIQLVLSRAADEAQQRVALAAFEALSRRLAMEMALKPLPGTEALAVALRERRQAALHRSSRPPSTPSTSTPPTPPTSARRWVATPTGRLVGRVVEVRHGEQLLGQPGLQLLTIRGAGGVGKTRLVQELAVRLGATRKDGAAWVSLSAAETATDLLDTLTDALGVPLASGPVMPQLTAWLAERTMLIVLDNFEQLVPHAGLLAPLLESAPSVQWLVTSREALGLPQEHILVLAGLDTDGQKSDALALLSDHAARHGHQLAGDELTAAVRIVTMLQGMPLAIELAAGWLAVMSPAEVAEAAEADLGFLQLDGAARPEAHRSLRAVFDTSWRLLTAAQRAALAGLTPMYGAFDRHAAREVGRCDAAMLLNLAGKSLVQRESAGQFRLHRLVRQFAAEAVGADEVDRLRRRHAGHFLARVAMPPLLEHGSAEPARVAALLPCLPDIAAAWRWAVDARRFDWLGNAQANMEGLLSIARRADEAVASRADEALELAAIAAGALPSEDPLRLRLDCWRVASLVTLGRSAEGEALAEQLLAMGSVLAPAQRCTLAVAKARLAHERGEPRHALEWATRALAEANAADLPAMRMRCMKNLAVVRWALGDLEGSEALWLEMLLLAEQRALPMQRARAQRGLGVLYQQQGQPARGLALLQDSAAFFRGHGDPAEVTEVQRGISFVLRDLGQHEAQRAAAVASVEAAEALGWPNPLASALFALALADEDLANSSRAAATYRRCLRLAVRSRMTPLILRCIYGLASLQEPESRAQALAWLVFVRSHPALRHSDIEEVQARRLALAPTLAELAAANGAASAIDLERLCAMLLAGPD